MRESLVKGMSEKPKNKGIFEIFRRALELERMGKKIVHMEIGRPDFDTPQIIKNAAIEALNKGVVHYTDDAGILNLRKAISNRIKDMHDLSYDPTNQVLITVGASEALDLIWRTFLDKDDQVMIPSPYYGAYTSQLDYSDKKYVLVPILNEDGTVAYDENEFEKRLTSNTKMLLINSPNNPTGHVMNIQDLEMIARLSKKYDLIVVSDECYDHYVFEGEHKSIATLDGMKERTLIVNSTSKTFSMTGWRIGYILGAPLYIDKLTEVHAQTTICPTSFAQYGAIAAYTENIPELKTMAMEFRKRRDYISNFLETVDGVKYVKPAGAFYIFLNVEEFGMSGPEFCEKLIETKGIALCPGTNFGDEWDNYVRISYSCSLEDIKYGMKGIREFIEATESL